MNWILLLIDQVRSEHPVLRIHRTLHQEVLSHIQKRKVLVVRHSDVAKGLDKIVRLVERSLDLAAIADARIIHTHQLVIPRACIGTYPRDGVVWVVCVEVGVGSCGNEGRVSPVFELDSRIIW